MDSNEFHSNSSLEKNYNYVPTNLKLFTCWKESIFVSDACRQLETGKLPTSISMATPVWVTLISVIRSSGSSVEVLCEFLSTTRQNKKPIIVQSIRFIYIFCICVYLHRIYLFHDDVYIQNSGKIIKTLLLNRKIEKKTWRTSKGTRVRFKRKR